MADDPVRWKEMSHFIAYMNVDVLDITQDVLADASHKQQQ